MKQKIVLFWFRRDLRLKDNAGLYYALKIHSNVVPLFVFDKNILDKLEDKTDARVTFIYNNIIKLRAQLIKGFESDILIKYGDPIQIYRSLLEQYNIEAVYTNRDYEPYAKDRDNKVMQLLRNKNIPFKAYKDHVIFESQEVQKDDKSQYVVFTPYKKKWYSKLNLNSGGYSYYIKSYPSLKYTHNLKKIKFDNEITLKTMGFGISDIEIPEKVVKQSIILRYDKDRNFPAINGTSKLGIHYRFGTISIREKVRKALRLSEVYVSELIWRDFYSSILDVYPYVVNEPFREKYNRINWRYDKEEFTAWCEGKTGYPLVDAGMRELNQTGYMHNRVRMVVASFLTKHLLIDWKLGEAYFAKKLLDYDLASNNGGWQWAAGCGTDAAPYFRIFNPESQLKKFDKELKYTKKWIPEYGTKDYVDPIVNHKEARDRCLAVYKDALNNASQ